MKIVEFNDSFKNQVIPFVLKIQRDEFHVPITLEMQPDLQEISSYYAGHRGKFWLALHEHDGKEDVIGTIAMIGLQQHQAALKKMFVEKDFRGKEHGVGAALLETLFNYCRSQAVEAIFLSTTTKFQAAHRFYEKNGFQAISEADLPIDFPKVTVDTLFYRKLL